MKHTRPIFSFVLGSILGLVFLPFSASAVVLVSQQIEQATGEPSATCYVDPAQSVDWSPRFTPETFSGDLGSITLHVKASSTQTWNLAVRNQTNLEIIQAQATVNDYLGYVTWNYDSSPTFWISSTSTYRLAISQGSNLPFQMYGTTATTSSTIFIHSFGGSGVAYPNPPCEPDFMNPYIVIATDSFNTAFDTSQTSGSGIYPEPLDCNFGDLSCHTTNALSWAFVPSADSWEQFGILKDDIKNKAPFGYFTSAAVALSGITGTSTPSFSLATSSPIMTYIFTPLRSGLLWLLYFAAGLWIYKRLTHVQP